MSLGIGIVGLPNVGKSTLFNALTKKSVPAENFPFCTIDPSVGVVAVPDYRLEKLGTFSNSEKVIPASVEFVDIAGLVHGASEGEGLGNTFLAHIREVDAIAMMVRIFEDEDIHHVRGHIDPLDDISAINTELALADLQTVEGRIEKLSKDLKRGDKDAKKEAELLDKLKTHLETGNRISELDVADDEHVMLNGMHLLSSKPILYVLNKKAGSLNLDDENDDRWVELETFLAARSAIYVKVDAGVEFEVKDFDGDERGEFRKELGATPDSGIDELIRKGFELLDLITYFTTGEKETRAWPIKRGWTAPLAGTAIHTDFKDKFIKADVVFWKDLLDAGSRAEARDKGLIRTEGKEYVVQDGDVIEFKI